MGVRERSSHRHSHQTATREIPNYALQGAQAELQRRRELEGIRVNHGSPPTTAWLATLKERYAQRGGSRPPAGKPAPAQPVETVPAFPSLLVAMLKERVETAGRVYLLLRHLDPQGRGWVSVDTARQALTDKSSRLHVCGWRRLRQILHQGAGIFWQRDGQDRLWLRGPHKIAQQTGFRAAAQGYGSICP